jgi:predicted dehydrogenase
MLNIGIAGVWHVHTDDYARQIRMGAQAAITAVWDEDPEIGLAWAQKNGAVFIPDLDTLLNRADIGAVVCNTPTTHHEQILIKAAKAGKHIFTEKLLATTVSGAEAICRAVEEAGVVCTVSLPLLSSPWVLYAKKMIVSGALGRITGARMRRSHSGVSDRWLPERWFDVSRSGGGAMMDLGAHPVYVLAYLLGEPVRVSGMMTNLYGTTSDENAIALVEFPGGVLGTCETAFVTFGVPDLLEVYGTEGAVFIRDGEVSVITKTMQETGLTACQPSRLPDALPSPIERFISACLSEGTSPEHLGPRDAMTMTKIIASAYLSNAQSQTIIL